MQLTKPGIVPSIEKLNKEYFVSNELYINRTEMGKRKREIIELDSPVNCIDSFCFDKNRLSKNREIYYGNEDEINSLKPKKKKQKISVTSTENIEIVLSSTNDKISCNNFDKKDTSQNIEDSSTTIAENIDEIESKGCKNYALRPRPCLRRPIYKRDFIDDELSSCSNNSPTVEVFRRRRGRGGQRLSKYRRRTANARERHRMREINNAFKTLREVLPRPTRMKESSLTKITTLRMAVDYIQALGDLLNNSDITPSSTPSSIVSSNTNQTQNFSSTNSSTSFQETLITDFLFNLTSSASFGDSLTSILGTQGSLSSKDLKDELGITYSLEDGFSGLQNSEEEIEEDPIALLLSSDTETHF
ncbi:UNVERIFIED_CONTAM: hypothetical protein RMT77_001088 [Armadillidium vulgare]